jgi:hypothetical protein
MMFLKGLSPFTRALAVLVLLGAMASGYWKMRYAPIRAQTQHVEKELGELRQDIRQARTRVERLRQEAATGQRWASYAQVLREQSTGKSLRDILAACGTAAGPEVQVRGLRFERGKEARGFLSIEVSFHLEGRYDELMRLLHELDTAFPPIEITGADLRVPENEEEDAQHWVSADLEGVVHEPL